MRDKITKKKIRRFDYYQFLVDRKLWISYCCWLHDPSIKHSRSEYKNRHDYVVSLGLFSEIKGSFIYDRFVNGNISSDEAKSIIHKEWLTYEL